MTNWDREANDIFLDALEIVDIDRRHAFIASQCDDNEQLRARVQSLLDAHRPAADLLGDPTALLRNAVDRARPIDSLRASEGVQIGPYKLLQKIGEGGFGVVYMVEQSGELRRTVALKVIKPGMDTKEVVARFESERQALGMMDHPNIAKVLDAGTTEDLRPYFVMELVKGLSVTEYCDKHNLPITERLQLFVDVCHAVQHAHHKGVIHRDIKPSNVMVTSHDGNPVVKVIDFGVAKAVTNQLTEKTLFTRYGQMLGTPQYMSPEQAEMSELDVDTRADVYGLGVLLYELLTGTTPLSPQELKEAAYNEIIQLVQEKEAPRPSIRLSSLENDADIVAARRKTTSAKLRSTLVRELDWIVARALEKDRNRRYPTANDFAQDVDRYLKGEAVEACPPSTLYRLRKLVRNHRRIATMSSVVVMTMLVGLLSTLLALQEANRQSQEADKQKTIATDNAKLARSLLSNVQEESHLKASLASLAGDTIATEDAVRSGLKAGMSDAWAEGMRGRALFLKGWDRMSERDQAIKHLETAVELGNESFPVYATLARVTDYERADHFAELVKSTKPKDEIEEYYSRSFTEWMHSPFEFLELMDRLCKKHATPRTLDLRTTALEHIAIETQSVQYADKMVEAADAASELEPDLGRRLWMRNLAVKIAIRNDDQEALQRYVSVGHYLAKRILGEDPGHDHVAAFYRTIGDFERAAEVYRVGAATSPRARQNYLKLLIRINNHEEALRQLDELDANADDIMANLATMPPWKFYYARLWLLASKRQRARVLAMRASTRDEARSVLQSEIMELDPKTFAFPQHLSRKLVDDCGMLHFIGYGTEAEEATKLWLSKRQFDSELENRMRFYAGEIDETELLRRVGKQNRERATRRAQWWIVEKQLGVDDREGAAQILVKRGSPEDKQLIEKLRNPDWR